MARLAAPVLLFLQGKLVNETRCLQCETGAARHLRGETGAAGGAAPGFRIAVG